MNSKNRNVRGQNGSLGSAMPHLKYIADVHPRVHFCREAALMHLRGGLDKLVCRDYGEPWKKECYDLYLDGVPLVNTGIPGCGTCATRLYAGYGDGLMNEQRCLAVRDRLNEGYSGLEEMSDVLAPFIGLMKSGMYLAADFDLFAVQSGNYFWDVPRFSSELHFTHLHFCGGSICMDAPLFMAPTQRAAQMVPERVEYYRARLCEGERFPRAVALYLNGGVALLLDGHHKAAACAAEGLPVKTVVIFPIESEEAVREACGDKKRLYLHHSDKWKKKAGPLNIRDGEGNLLSRVGCLQHMKRRKVTEKALENVQWGRNADECRTNFDEHPSENLLTEGTMIPPDQIRNAIGQQMKLPKGMYDMELIGWLRQYAKLFPQSKWLTQSERMWLERPYEEFMPFSDTP